MAGEKRDLIVPKLKYAFVLDGTKGVTRVYTGPTVITPSAQDVPCVYDEKKGILPVATLEEALRSAVEIKKGEYAILRNPAPKGEKPNQGSNNPDIDLDIGKEIVIPGPASFALWPLQTAEVIPGHHLKSDQYLVVKVSDEEEAKRNWSQAVVRPATDPGAGAPGAEIPPGVTTSKLQALTMGQRIVIKGTEVSFYIPPTGVVVVPEGVDAQRQLVYVRAALTLERLEYAVLRDESGTKRYVRGPVVAFPTPTETFIEDKDKKGNLHRKFRAIELSPLNAIYLKVIADFEEDGKKYQLGEELFITGKDTAIYYPREEVAVIRYDRNTMHWSKAIPVGEGRYVMDRFTAKINTLKGPAQALLDPRKEVFMKRVLTEKQASDWYPHNAEVQEVNARLRKLASQAAATRGALTEGDVEANVSKEAKTKGGLLAAAGGGYGGVMGVGGVGAVMTSNAASYMIADSSLVTKDQGFVGEGFTREGENVEPRSITLDTKYQGVPVVKVWTGFAVLVVGESANPEDPPRRRVVKGPATVLVDWDESFEVMELSTGKPKTTDKLLRTIYLRTDNTQVSDLVTVVTADHIPVALRLGYRVTFEGDSSKWWAVENYVKFLTDEMRSLLMGQVRKLKTEPFNANATDIIRGIVLGAGTEGIKGRLFQANNMRITDVEVLGVEILNPAIKAAIQESELAVVTTNIALNQLRRGMEVTKEKEAIIKEEAEVRASTMMRKNELAIEVADSEVKVILAKYVNDLKGIEDKAKIQAATEQMKDFEFDQEMGRRKRLEEQNLAIKEAAQALELLLKKAESEAVAVRFTAAKDGLAEIAKVVRDTDAAVRISEALSMQMALGGPSFSDVAIKVLGSIPALETLVQKIAPNGHVIPANGSGEKKPSVGA